MHKNTLYAKDYADERFLYKGELHNGDKHICVRFYMEGSSTGFGKTLYNGKT